MKEFDKLPEDLRAAVEMLLSSATKHNYHIVGALVKQQPSSFTILRNTSGDQEFTAKVFRAVADTIEQAGKIENVEIHFS